MASHATKIRGACEQCHRRKIRCILGANETKCVNCLHNNTDCLFAPRAKPGRPRKDAGKEPKPTRAAQECPAVSSEPDNPSFTQPASLAPSVVDMSELRVDSLETETAWNNMFWGEVEDRSSALSESLGFGYNNFFPGSDESMATNLSCADSGVATSWSPPSFIPMVSLMPEADDLDFDTTLQHCKKLDDYCQQMGRAPLSASEESEVYSIMTKICSAAATKTPSTGHCPDSALSLAAVLKVLELCGKLAISSVTPSMRSVLSLKKLDLLLLQIKYFMAEVGQHTAVNQAVELHNHIEVTIEYTWPNFKW